MNVLVIILNFEFFIFLRCDLSGFQNWKHSLIIVKGYCFLSFNFDNMSGSFTGQL